MARYTPAVKTLISDMVRTQHQRDNAHAQRNMDAVTLLDADLLVIHTELDTAGYDFPGGRPRHLAV